VNLLLLIKITFCNRQLAILGKYSLFRLFINNIISTIIMI